MGSAGVKLVKSVHSSTESNIETETQYLIFCSFCLFSNLRFATLLINVVPLILFCSLMHNDFYGELIRKNDFLKYFRFPELSMFLEVCYYFIFVLLQ